MFDVKEAFSKYVKSRVKREDKMDFEQFCSIPYEYGFPVILLDLIFALTGQLINEN